MKAKFIREEDFMEIEGWYHARNMDAPYLSLYPETGFIVPGIAAGFLYETDSDVCMLDGYISNPSTSDFDRDEALDLVTEALLHIAEARDFKKCIVITTSGAIVARAEKFGFRNKGSNILLIKEGL